MKDKLSKKIRADQLMVNQGLASSRTKAQAYIMSGNVFCGEHRIDKASSLLKPDEIIFLKQKEHPYVSRGGVKLKAALDFFKIDVSERTCLDIGASTGGFTDCLLQSNAKEVIALDVGHGQLDWKIRNDSRVVVLEKMNFRKINPDDFSKLISLITIDVSFISLTLILPNAFEILKRSESDREKVMICLIKPQFEVGKNKVGKKGVVKDEVEIKKCIEKIENFCKNLGLKTKEVIASPLKGSEGNQEFLLVSNV